MSPDKTSAPRGPRLGLQGYLGTTFFVLSLAIGAALVGIGYYTVTHTVETAVEAQVDAIARDIKRDIADTRMPARSLLAGLSQGPVAQVRSDRDLVPLLPLLQALLRAYDMVDEILIGLDNGDSLMVKLVRDEEDLRFFDAPSGSALIVRQTHAERLPPRQREYFYYDGQLRPLGRWLDDESRRFVLFDRPWFQAAMKASGPVEVGPMVSFNRHRAGLVIAQKSRNGQAVIGLAIDMGQLSARLAGKLPTPGSLLALFRPDGTPIALDRGLMFQDNSGWRLRDLEDFSPIIRLGLEKYQQGLRTSSLRIEKGDASTGLSVMENGRDWLMVLEELETSDQPDDFLVMAIPRDEMYAGANRFLRDALLGMGGLLLLTVPIVWLVARRVTTPLRFMTERTRATRQSARGRLAPRWSLLAEVDDLMRNVESMRENQHKILSIIGMIGGDRDFQSLLGRVLKEIMTVTESEGGLLMMLDEQRKVFESGLCGWDDDPPRPFSPPGDIPREAYAIYRALDEYRYIVDRITRDDPRAPLAVAAPGLADPAVPWVDMIGLILRDRMGEPLGGICLYRRGRTDKDGFDPDEIDFIETIAAAAAIVLETQALVKSQFDLRDALIHILAGAIDTKSPYTGGHCARVPVIFQMLLEAAHETKDGPLRDFRLDTASREEARLAAWLHDCGKVTTPEYVMDKATKLETLYDRIHEIRTRFEVLKRDAEIAGLRAMLDGADPQEEQRKLIAALKELDDDFAFVAACNIGGEHMEDRDLERLAAIGRRAWVRTLDKRLGVSRGELTRLEQAGAPEAPTRETLLADRPEHIIPRGEKDRLPADNPWGFKLDVPEALYNRGELYNLSVRRGTLTEEERYKINDHITRTIMMLEGLPLPKHLRRVPEIAGAHHETMDGRGYPRRITREEMSWEARMMAIADIFEALTAGDRPYKTSKTLSEALKIMELFKERHHIDPHLYDLFLAAEIPRRYAAKHLKPEQNDL